MIDSSKIVGEFLVRIVTFSQTLITLSVVISYIYSFFIKKKESKILLKFYRQARPVQLILGSIFLGWWVRSNSWKSKNLPVDPKIRMAIFQYSLITFYIAFDLIFHNWENPDISV